MAGPPILYQVKPPLSNIKPILSIQIKQSHPPKQIILQMNNIKTGSLIPILRYPMLISKIHLSALQRNKNNTEYTDYDHKISRNI